MATSNKPAAAAQGAAAAKTDDLGVRDYIRTMKKNAKGIRAIASLPGANNDPALKAAIQQLGAQNAKLKELALKKVAFDIDEALKAD